MLWLNNTVPSVANLARVPTHHALTYVLLPAAAGASTVNITAGVSHVKKEVNKIFYVSVWCAFPGKDHIAGHQEPLKLAVLLNYNHIL